MLLSELLELISQGEGATLEFKRDDIAPEKIARVIVSFANASGGTILIGVEDDGTISGIQRDDLQEWVMNTVIGEYTSPPIQPGYEEITVNGEKVAAVVIPQGGDTPYALRHKSRDDIYIRRGNTCQLATREEMLRLFQMGGLIFPEKIVVPDCHPAALDEHRIKSYFTEIRGYDDETWESEKESILRNHDFIKAGGPSGDLYVVFFACILFAKTPCRHLSQAGIRLLVYSNNRDDEERDIVMDKALDIPFIGLNMGEEEEMHLTNLAVEYLSPHISHEDLDAEISHQRKALWDYPPLVLREVMINAFAHRDWTKKKQTEVTVYADCLEVTSPGALPNGMTIEKIIAGVQAPRNSKMQGILQACGFIENRGMGIRRRVIPEMREKNGCEPIFEATEDYFRVILPKKSP